MVFKATKSACRKGPCNRSFSLAKIGLLFDKRLCTRQLDILRISGAKRLISNFDDSFWNLCFRIGCTICDSLQCWQQVHMQM